MITWIPIKEAAELCGVSRRSIYNWIKSNKINYTRIAGGNIRIDKESLILTDTQINIINAQRKNQHQIKQRKFL